MTKRMAQYLAELTQDDQARLGDYSRAELVRAWPHRESLRARIVVRANLDMLRNLRALQS